jgi:predicted transglutaminase-like cysteine proteinase
MNRCLRLLIVFSLAVLVGCASSPKPTGIAPAVEAKVAAWKNLIEAGKGWPDQRRLQATNDFLNDQLVFVDDIIHWQQDDYWATPLETLVSGGGDCEDFALTKYFTLTAMGMDETRLRLSYVKALSINKPHMVVSYYTASKATPLVLDNLIKKILPATERDDLYPVYSFNGSGLWIDKRHQSSKQIDDSERLSLWKQLLHTIDVEAKTETDHICRYQYFHKSRAEAEKLCH